MRLHAAGRTINLNLSKSLLFSLINFKIAVLFSCPFVDLLSLTTLIFKLQLTVHTKKKKKKKDLIMRKRSIGFGCVADMRYTMARL